MPAGVFTLGDLAKLGKLGAGYTAWAQAQDAQKAANEKVGSMAGTAPAGTKAGFYRIPGTNQALYVDPARGIIPPEFTSKGISAKDYMGGMGDDGLAKIKEAPQQTNLRQEINYMDAGFSKQDAQDKTLGIGAYQRGVIGSSPHVDPVTGAIIRPGVPTPQPTMTAQPTIFQDKPDFAAVANRELEAKAAADRTDARNQDAWAGLAALRQKMGLNPETGTSPEAAQEIADTYGRIKDPGAKASYIYYQDPASLSPELRQARSEARAADYAKMNSENSARQNYEFDTTGKYLNGEQKAAWEASGKPGQFVASIGNVMATDPGTGRETFVANVPTGVSYSKPKYDRLGDFSKRAGGAAIGTALAVVAVAATGGFGLAAAPHLGFGAAATLFSGGYTGLGGPMPTKGLGSWKWQAAHIPSGAEIGMAVAFAGFAGGYRAAKAGKAVADGARFAAGRPIP